MASNSDDSFVPPKASNSNKIARAAVQSIAGAIPGFGGILSAAAGVWSENEQDKMNAFLVACVEMLRDEMKEKYQTMGDVLIRLDMHDEAISKRVETSEYQSLLRKAFREWAGAESQQKRDYIRNVLTNAAATNLSSDDVVRLYLDWLYKYSEFHLAVVGYIHRYPEATRLEIWQGLGKKPVREDSADADLFRLLIRELSTGGIIRQFRQKDSNGNFMKVAPSRSTKSNPTRVMTSAFEDDKPYVLTDLGSSFVHYAMTDVPIKISYSPKENESSEMVV